MEPNPSHLHSRHTFTTVMTKLHLHRFSRALSKAPSPARNVCLPTDDPLNSLKDLQASSPPIKIRPVVHFNSQTMRNYALQRSNKIPLRVPAAFPKNLNFSQQTFCLFDAPKDHEEEGDLSWFLADSFNGPPPSPEHANYSKAHARTIRYFKQSLSGKLVAIHTHLKARRGSSISPALPTFPAARIPDKSPSPTNLIPSQSPDLNSRSESHITNEQYVNELDEEFKALFYCKPRAIKAPCHQEPNRVNHARVQPMSPRSHSPKQRTSHMLKRITEDLEDDKEPDYLRRRRAVTSPHPSRLPMLAITHHGQCPHILDAHLHASPFYPSFPTIRDWSPQTPNSSQGEHLATAPHSSSQAPTPSTSDGLGTPTFSPLSARLPMICTKLSMDYGSPGIVNSNEHIALAPDSLTLNPLADYRVYLQSPPSLPSSKNQRSLVHRTQTCGSGADTLPSLELLSDICQRSPACVKEKHSAIDGTSTGD